MAEVTIQTCAKGLHASVTPPGDKSISHRALLLAARAEGTSRISGLSHGDDVVRTRTAIEMLGVPVSEVSGHLEIAGGLAQFHPSSGPIDVGNSGTALRLLAGYCANFDWPTTLIGDESISRRPMDRVAEPLRLMGAEVEGKEGGKFVPLTVRGGSLRGIDYEMQIPSAQVKGAVLLAGLGAHGPTTVRERVRTRAHSEEMLQAFGADIDVEQGGHVVTVRRSTLKARDFAVPADPSQAAFWVVAALITPGSKVTIPNVYTGFGRAGYIEVLRRMGGDIEVRDNADQTGTIDVRYSSLRSTKVDGAEIAGVIDEIPILAVAASQAEGTTVFADAGELRVKESDRIETTASELSKLGATVRTSADGLTVEGGAPLVGAFVESHGDHRIAMAMAIAGLVARGTTVVRGWEAVATSYPEFMDDLLQLTQ